MDKLQCKTCGSWNTKKHGVRKSGRQKYHCHDGGIYSTTEAGARDGAALYHLIEQRHHEGVSQRGISRVTGVSRPTIIAYLKKNRSAHW